MAGKALSILSRRRTFILACFCLLCIFWVAFIQIRELQMVPANVIPDDNSPADFKKIPVGKRFQDPAKLIIFWSRGENKLATKLFGSCSNCFIWSEPVTALRDFIHGKNWRTKPNLMVPANVMSIMEQRSFENIARCANINGFPASYFTSMARLKDCEALAKRGPECDEYLRKLRNAFWGKFIQLVSGQIYSNQWFPIEFIKQIPATGFYMDCIGLQNHNQCINKVTQVCSQAKVVVAIETVNRNATLISNLMNVIPETKLVYLAISPDEMLKANCSAKCPKDEALPKLKTICKEASRDIDELEKLEEQHQKDGRVLRVTFEDLKDETIVSKLKIFDARLNIKVDEHLLISDSNSSGTEKDLPKVEECDKYLEAMRIR